MTTVLGIFGDPVKHSKSPRMWNAAIEHLGLDARYLPFHVRRGTVGDALVGMRALGIRGVNVTLPHKEDVIPHLDVVDDAARSIGADERKGSIRHGKDADFILMDENCQVHATYVSGVRKYAKEN